jgi:hypothetical protein
MFRNGNGLENFGTGMTVSVLVRAPIPFSFSNIYSGSVVGTLAFERHSVTKCVQSFSPVYSEVWPIASSFPASRQETMKCRGSGSESRCSIIGAKDFEMKDKPSLASPLAR